MSEQKLPESQSSAERILDLGATVYDLRNNLLYERVGEEGMQTLAEHEGQQRVRPKTIVKRSRLKSENG
jgi:hypothetical protein